MIIAVASGKGGTGKTTIAAGLALSVNNSVYIDCDVEEPNGHILLKPEFQTEENIYKKIPQVDYNKCTFCGKCSEVCEFNALMILKDEVLLFKELCHSCGACEYFCPEKAITEIDEKIGVMRTGKVAEASIQFTDGLLTIGEMAAAPLINKVKENIAREKINIVDSPPGTSCSMVETVRDSDYCILVTEPTPFGLNDLKLAVNALRIIGIPFGVIVNKHDDKFIELQNYCDDENIKVLMKIPFSQKIAEAYSKGYSITEFEPNYKMFFSDVIERIGKLVEMGMNNE